MNEHTTSARRFAAVGATALLGLVAGLAGLAGGTARAGDETLPGDTPIAFWPHETGALSGTSETFVDIRDDGSYYDPGLERRVVDGQFRDVRR